MALTDFPDLHMIDFIVREDKNNQTGKNTKKRDLNFLVRWIGQDDETYESWNTLKYTTQLKEFLLEHPNKFYKKLGKKIATYTPTTTSEKEDREEEEEA